jgi:hypothetical protein
MDHRGRRTDKTLTAMPKIIQVKRLFFGKRFLAITLTELILTTEKLNATELNHELIHVAQQRELLYLPFFIWYGIEWLALFVKYRDSMQAYYHLRFEQEAYRHQHDLSYLKHRRHYRYSQ